MSVMAYTYQLIPHGSECYDRRQAQACRTVEFQGSDALRKVVDVQRRINSLQMTIHAIIFPCASLQEICLGCQTVPSRVLADHSVQAILMQRFCDTNSNRPPTQIRTSQIERERLRAPWSQLLKFLTTPPRVATLHGGAAALISKTAAAGYISSQLRPPRYRGTLSMCWPLSSGHCIAGITMGGSNSAERQPRQYQQGHRADPEYDLLQIPHHQSQEGRELPRVSDDIWRKDYHELMLKCDELKRISAAQEREIASYRKSVTETASDEIFRRLDEVQNQLRELSVNLDWFTRGSSMMFQENTKRSQHKFSMRDNLDRLTRALVAVTEENKALKEGHRLTTDRPLESENEDFESMSESGEQVPSGASTIHRKEPTSDLRSQPAERHPFQLQGPHEQLVHGPEGLGDLDETVATRAEVLALKSQLKSAKTHIVNIGGNLGALLPRETFKNVRTDQDICMH